MSATRRPSTPQTYTLAELAALARRFDDETARLAAALGPDDTDGLIATQFVDWLREKRPPRPGRPRGRRDTVRRHVSAETRRRWSQAQRARRERERRGERLVLAAA